jgi:hypothetical protein
VKNEPEPLYNFIMNPYPDMRISKCPLCDGKTGQRKLPLAIHIEPGQLVALNYTCRYCRTCDLLIAHKHEIEELLATLFSQRNPDMIGKDYLVYGTMEKTAWRQNMKKPSSQGDAVAAMYLFKTYYRELRVHEEGWFPRGKTPPVRQPPPSTLWVKG